MARDDTNPQEEGSDADNPYFKRNLDLEPYLASATTELERLYYGHTGRKIIKWKHYLPLYDAALRKFIGRPVRIVEIGVASGGSLELWRKLLGPAATIMGVDINPAAKMFEAEGIEIRIGDQGDRGFLENLAAEVGEADVVIDDGSHFWSHQIATFEVLFPIVKEGGVYACEDLHTSYWPTYGQGQSFVDYTKDLIDRLHARYRGLSLPAADPANFIDHATVADSIVFFHKARRNDTYMIEVGRH